LAILTGKVGQTDLAFDTQSRFISRPVQCMWDYKCLCTAVTICAPLVNIQTHIQTDRQTTFWPAYMN